MQPGSPETLMTPKEAAFICGALPAAHFLRQRLDTAIMDWALAVSPPKLVNKWRDVPSGGTILRGLALATAGREAGEELSVTLNDMELTIVALAATATVEAAVEDAGSIDSLYEEVIDELLPEEQISEDGVEAFKSSMFQDRLVDIQMGNNIIASITNYLKSH